MATMASLCSNALRTVNLLAEYHLVGRCTHRPERTHCSNSVPIRQLEVVFASRSKIGLVSIISKLRRLEGCCAILLWIRESSHLRTGGAGRR
jgi:hypothetical protein